ncbi:MAG: hypothetical protein GY838_17475, partial [bacterium]|nr:hypothetical protein [bacterium]
MATIDGTAVGGADFTALSTTAEIPIGGSTAQVDVTISNDDDVEDDEAFSVALSSPEGAILGTVNSTAVLIIDNDQPRIRDLRLVHVEPDLVHLAWWTFDGNVSTTLQRRDADEAGAWDQMATINGGDHGLWRDFLVEEGIRYEYRLTPYDGGGAPGEAAILALSDPVPASAGEAVLTVVPGLASVVPDPSIPDEANAFAGVRDYVFHLTPDPGPDFVSCTVDVYLDEQPASADPDEPAQPWDDPFFGLARDDLSCAGPAGTKVVDAHPCNGGTCDLVVPGLAPGTHRLRFVLTDSGGGISERAIVQDMHPWLAQNATSS